MNGETRFKWIPVNLTNTTTLTGGAAPWNQSSNFFSTVASCATNNRSHLSFWPIGFNLSGNQYPATANTWLRPINSTCLKETPNSAPLVSTTCINIDSNPCSIYEQRPDLDIQVSVTPTVKNWNRLVHEFNFSITRSRLVYDRFNRPSFDLLLRKRGFAFVFREPIEEFSARNIAYVFISNLGNDSWFISAGQMVSENSTTAEFYLYRPARISPAKVLGPLSNALNRFRKTDLYPRVEVPISSIPLLVQFLFQEFGSTPNANQALRKIPGDVTIIYKEAIILYSVLLAILITLFFTREIIVFFFVSRQPGISMDEVFATDFNELSKTLRRTMERENDIQYTNDHALLGVHVDERGSMRIAPISSPPVAME